MCEFFVFNSCFLVVVNFFLCGFVVCGGCIVDYVDGWGVVFYDGECCEVVVEDWLVVEFDLVLYYGYYLV